MIDYDAKRKKEEQFTAILFAVFSWILLFSLVYVRNGRIYLGINNSQFLVYLLLGLFTAFVELWYYYEQPLDFYYHFEGKGDRELKFRVHKFCRLLVMTFATTGIWQCVLLPISGIGLAEYFFVFVLLVLMLLNYSSAYKSKNQKYAICVNSPMSLIIFQAGLFLIKVTSWIMPENFYSASITGNDTMRWILAIIIALFIISGLIVLKRKFIPISEESKSTVEKIANKVAKIFGKAVNFVSNFLISLTSGPIILLIVIGLAGFLAFFGIIKIKDDLLNLIEPILESSLSTGKYQTQQTPLFVFCQIFTFILYSLYLYLIKPTKADDDDFKIYCEEMEKNLPDDEKESFDKILNQQRSEYENDLMYNHRAYEQLAKKSLEEKIKNDK